MAEGLKPGDVVELISGSPKMTVSYFENDGTNAVCGWFDGIKPKVRTFAVIMLKRVSA